MSINPSNHVHWIFYAAVVVKNFSLSLFHKFQEACFLPLTTKIMAIPVAEFSREGYKIYLSLAENEITVFCELVLWGGVKKWREIWLSKSIFYVKNHPNLSDFFLVGEYEIRNTFFVSDIFWQHQFLNHFIFLRLCPIFDSSSLLYSPE